MVPFILVKLQWLSRNFTWKHTSHHFKYILSTKAGKNSWGLFHLLLVVSQAVRHPTGA